MRFGFSPMTARMIDSDGAFKIASELGLDFIELDFDLHEVLPHVQDPKKIRDLCAATGVATTLHLSFVDLNLASLMPVARRAAVERTLNGLEYAAAVGATAAVLHSGRNYLDHPQARALAREALHASLEELRGAGELVVLENLALDERDLIRTPEELRDLTDRFGMRNCLDFGHAHIQGTREGFDANAAYLSTLGERITHLHVHNNHGLEDEHRPSDQGSIDYAPFAGFLRDFQGTICLEIGPFGAEGVARSLAHIRRVAGEAL